MNIVIVSTAYPLRGGMAHYAALLYEHLSKRHNVSVVTFTRQYPGVLFPGSTQEEAGADAALRIPTERLMDSINPFTWFSAARRIVEMKPELILLQYWIPFLAPCFGTIVRQVKRQTNGTVNALYICHNIVPHEHRPFDKLLTRYALKPADSFIVQSGVVENDLQTLFPGKPYRRVPHPVYSIFGDPIPKSAARKSLGVRQSNVMLFFGYIRKYKGLETLLRAMPRVLASVKVKLLIVGEFYEDEVSVRTMIQKLGIGEWIDIHARYVPNDQVAPYFSAADVVVLPYTSATQSGIVQIAYNFNRPVIVTDVGGLSESVVDGTSGRVIPPGNDVALADAIVRFYRKNEEGPFVRGVHAEKKKYSWQAMVGAIEELSGASRKTRGSLNGRDGGPRQRRKSRGRDHSRRRRSHHGPYGGGERGQ